MLVDTPGRKAELGEITMDNVTDDASAVLVTGKGRKQR
jgi:site-specific recombinase XerD